LRGGDWLNGDASHLLASFRNSLDPTYDSFLVGFRVASIESTTVVPAPSSLTVLLGVGVMVFGMEWWKKRRRRVRATA
jgi:hypothetical protein